VLDLQLSKWVTGLTKNGRKMIYLKASNHQYSDKIVVYDWADMDGEPSSSPAYIGSKARDLIHLLWPKTLICHHQQQVLVLLPHDEGTILFLLWFNFTLRWASNYEEKKWKYQLFSLFLFPYKMRNITNINVFSPWSCVYNKCNTQ